MFDTSLVGGSNAGHSFEDAPLGNGVIARRSSGEERSALIEFVKSVPSAPAQIAPFGGPENPVHAWLNPTFNHVRHPGTYKGAPELHSTTRDRPTQEEDGWLASMARRCCCGSVVSLSRPQRTRSRRGLRRLRILSRPGRQADEMCKSALAAILRVTV
jgi:hypothetical protein